MPTPSSAASFIFSTWRPAPESRAQRLCETWPPALECTLIQTDRFGTSVAQALRVHSDSLRTERRQRAEEQAAKTTVKMIIPLVLFILPSILIVTLGPAIIELIRQLGPVSGGR